MQGWIKLHRKLTENELYFSERFTRAQAWVDLLLLATHKPQTVFIRGVEINLKPGELCYSQLSLAKRWKWNRKTVTAFLKFLAKREMLLNRTDIRLSHFTTVITIRNWHEYQADGQQDGQRNGQRRDNGTDTNKNVENEKNVKREARSLPKNEDESKALFRELHFINPEVEGAKFFAYYSARHWEGVDDWRELAKVWNSRTVEYAKRRGAHSTVEPARAQSKPLDDPAWKSRTYSCSGCGKVHRADEACELVERGE